MPCYTCKVPYKRRRTITAATLPAQLPNHTFDHYEARLGQGFNYLFIVEWRTLSTQFPSQNQAARG